MAEEKTRQHYEVPGYRSGQSGFMVVEAESPEQATELAKQGQGKFVEKGLTYGDVAFAAGAAGTAALFPEVSIPMLLGVGLGGATARQLYEEGRRALKQPIPPPWERAQQVGEDVTLGAAGEAVAGPVGKYVVGPAMRTVGDALRRWTPEQAYRLLGLRPPQELATREAVEAARGEKRLATRQMQDTARQGQESVEAAQQQARDTTRQGAADVRQSRKDLQAARETERVAEEEVGAQEKAAQASTKESERLTAAGQENLYQHGALQRSQDLLKQAHDEARHFAGGTMGPKTRLATGESVSEEGLQRYLTIFRQQNKTAFDAIRTAIGDQPVVEMPALSAALKDNRESIEKILFPMGDVGRIARRLGSAEETPFTMGGATFNIRASAARTDEERHFLDIVAKALEDKPVAFSFAEADRLVSYLGSKGYSGGELIGDMALGIYRKLHTIAKRDLYGWLDAAKPAEAEALRAAKAAYRDGKELLESSFVRALENKPGRVLETIFGRTGDTYPPEQIVMNLRQAKQLLPGDIMDKVTTGFLARSIERAEKSATGGARFSPTAWAQDLWPMRDVLPDIVGREKSVVLRAMIDRFAGMGGEEALARKGLSQVPLPAPPVTIPPVDVARRQAAQQGREAAESALAQTRERAIGSREAAQHGVETTREGARTATRAAVDAQRAAQDRVNDALAELRRRNMTIEGPWSYGQTRFFFSLLFGAGGGYAMGGGKGAAAMLAGEFAVRQALAKPWTGATGRFAADLAAQMLVQRTRLSPGEVTEQIGLPPSITSPAFGLKPPGPRLEALVP